ncbi:PotD/PotF family extracellular solute-binding protein [Lysinimonas soli]|uniref:PotD/PotF family extracellular solute-binding protein n=1 Tax=Lysinimonas soli TaxID=1074233 RepID=A0ABW0NKX0_9MICO
MPRSLPEDPLIRSLVVQARNAQLTRRGVLAGATGGAAALALAACAPTGSSKPAPASDISSSDKRMVWANWPLYMDTVDGTGAHPTLDAFTKATGIKVDYREDVDDNNTYYAKVKDQLALGKDIGADTVCLTDWMVSRWIRLGYTQKLDHSKIPNIKNLNPNLLNIDYDKGRNYSLPWQGGFAGICWNKDKFPKGFTSVSEMFKEPALKGRIEVLSEMRDTIGLIMLEQNVDISAPIQNYQFQNGLDELQKYISDGIIRSVKGNSYTEDLVSGDALAAICWSGDITATNASNGDHWEFAIPDAGGTLWNDNYLIPIGARHKANAEAVMNWYYDPKIAAEVAAYVNYITPVVGAKEEAAKIDPALAENNLIFPDEATLKKAHVFHTLTPAQEQSFTSGFQKVLLGA